MHLPSWRRKTTDFEALLRSARPEPRAELRDKLVRMIEQAPRPTRRGVFHKSALAGAFTALVLAGLAAGGGIGYAAHLVSSSVVAVKVHVLEIQTTSAPSVRRNSAAIAQYGGGHDVDHHHDDDHHDDHDARPRLPRSRAARASRSPITETGRSRRSVRRISRARSSTRALMPFSCSSSAGPARSVPSPAPGPTTSRSRTAALPVRGRACKTARARRRRRISTRRREQQHPCRRPVQARRHRRPGQLRDPCLRRHEPDQRGRARSPEHSRSGWLGHDSRRQGRLVRVYDQGVDVPDRSRERLQGRCQLQRRQGHRHL